jgi:glycosyltransferase involved in cell wall biosynthesis
MNFPSVSVCFPAYNEEKTVGSVLENAYKILKSNQIDFELIVCNDASKDNTGAIIDQFANGKPEVRVIHHQENKGIRDTFEELNQSARNVFVFLNSTDGQWKTESLLQMLPMTQKWDVIIASRKRKPYGLKRLFISWFFNFLPKFLFGVDTFDAGAVKLVRREIIEKFPLISSTPFSEAERIIRAVKAGYQVTEYPVEVEYRKTGKSTAVKWSVLRHTLADVFRVWLAVRFSKKNLKDVSTREE